MISNHCFQPVTHTHTKSLFFHFYLLYIWRRVYVCVYASMFLTSSSTVTKRLRNASCLSVVSFNSTKCGVQVTLQSYH